MKAREKILDGKNFVETILHVDNETIIFLE